MLASVLLEVCGAGEPPKLCEETLHPLPNGVGRGRVRFGNLLAGVSVELDLNEKVDLCIAEEPFRNAPMQEVPQHCVRFHEIVIHEQRGSLLRLFPGRLMDRSFSTRPLEELPFYGARNRKRKVRLPLFDLRRAQHLKKNAQGLLGNIGPRKARLLLGDTADRAVQHGNKSHNQECLDKLRFENTSRE
jgi:hypothetical protein